MTFSFIVPIYNAQETLSRCLDSILNQTYPSYEVWMIDDGSVDNSAAIAATYVEKDPRFMLIRQPNSGPSRARNRGLESAKGDVVAFVDSDDFIEPDYLQQIVQAFRRNNAQIVFFGSMQITLGSENRSSRNIPDLPDNQLDRIIALTKSDLFGYTWVKAISRQLIGDIRFDETLNLFEDEVFTCQIMEKQPIISWVEKPLYNQIIASGSLSRRTHQDYYAKCEAVYLAWKQLLLSMQAGNHEILQDKANHMTNVCKYYFLERKIAPGSFARGLSACTFFQNSNVDDALIVCIKEGRFAKALAARLVYRGKVLLKKRLSR